MVESLVLAFKVNEHSEVTLLKLCSKENMLLLQTDVLHMHKLPQCSLTGLIHIST